MPKVYIHNRGEIAVRIIRTCRAMGLQTAVGYCAGDADAMHVRCADEAFSLGGARVSDSYLNIDAVCGAIRRSAADLVHPGYGLLSESAAFARAVGDLGVTYIGPDPQALIRFGDKVVARHIAAQAGLALCPGTPGAVELDVALAEAPRIGFPLMVKAAAGGGGIGMAIVNEAAELEPALIQCVSRSQAAFGDGRVYLERKLMQPRHIEVQVVVLPNREVHVLGERECSVQRRHQKVVEEGPSPFAALAGPVRDAMYRAAKELMASHPYLGLATVEFLFEGSVDNPTPYFMEVNARLQVEHPVTELLTGVDLVALQLQIAAGEGALLASAPTLVTAGHAFEVRLYAEDPARGFIPQPGRLRELCFPETSNDVRVDAGYEQGDEITPLFDPLIAKICVHGVDRDSALRRLRAALADCTVVVEGKKKLQATNLSLLRQIVDSPEFDSGRYDTGLISRLDSPAPSAP